MRRRGIMAAVALLAVAGVGAQEAEVVYLEGEPERRTGSGELEWLDFGVQLFPGEQVITGRSDYVELEQGTAATIRVEPDTVFAIREVEQGGERRSVMSTSIGQVRYRFNTIAGRGEPLVGTNTTVAGIRGTELVVSAAADGSSLFIVEEGAVEVESAGQTVALGADQGVEVLPGQPPGEPFEVIGREQDYADWAAGRRDALVSDPAGAVEQIATSLAGIADQADEWYALFEAAREESDAALAELDEIADEAERTRYRDEVWFPLAQQTATAALNYRYYALSGLSLRRHALGAVYLEARTRSILDPIDGYEEFLATYEETVREFEVRFGRYLNDFDR